jgi:uncharacterized repeat protein (TIGR04138 family)
MPPGKPLKPAKSIHQVVDDLGLYPPEAFEFVQQGLSFTVQKIHGQTKKEDMLCRHVSGTDLCEGLRELALHRWGMLARTVLSRWNVRRTLDFGRIVFALVDSGWMQATPDDSLEDFREVFDFKTAFDAEYRIASLI